MAHGKYYWINFPVPEDEWFVVFPKKKKSGKPWKEFLLEPHMEG